MKNLIVLVIYIAQISFVFATTECVCISSVSFESDNMQHCMHQTNSTELHYKTLTTCPTTEIQSEPYKSEYESSNSFQVLITLDHTKLIENQNNENIVNFESSFILHIPRFFPEETIQFLS